MCGARDFGQWSSHSPQRMQGAWGFGGKGAVSNSVTGMSSMQSTGHGGRHNSHPVHSDSIMVCVNCCAPTMASTGQAGMQSVHPMHWDSSIRAICLGAVAGTLADSGNSGRLS